MVQLIKGRAAMNHLRALLDPGKENTEQGKIHERVEVSLEWGEGG